MDCIAIILSFTHYIWYAFTNLGLITIIDETQMYKTMISNKSVIKLPDYQFDGVNIVGIVMVSLSDLHEKALTQLNDW